MSASSISNSDKGILMKSFWVVVIMLSFGTAAGHAATESACRKNCGVAYGKCVQVNPEPSAFETICEPRKERCISGCAVEASKSQKQGAAAGTSSRKASDLPKQDAPPSKATTLFWNAFLGKNYEMMDVLLRQGADIDCPNCGAFNQTALMRTTTEAIKTSSFFGFDEEMRMLDFLLDRGVDVNFRNSKGQTALMLAVEQSSNGDNKTRLIQTLLEAGADPALNDEYGNSVLIGQVNSGYKGGRDSLNDFNHWLLNIKLFVSKGVEINHRNKSGMTALMYAAKGCGYDGARNLLALGADPTLKTPVGDTALTLAIEAAARDQRCNELVRLLSDPASATAVDTPMGVPAASADGRSGGLLESLRNLNEALKQLNK